MLPGNMMRLLCAVAAVAMVMTGCQGCPPTNPVDCTDATITFETPTSDQTVDSPFDVIASVTVPGQMGDQSFNIEAAQLSISGGDPIDGTVDKNRATFSGVTAPAGAQTLKVTIKQGSCSKSSLEVPITVRDACSNAAVMAVSFPQDVAPLGTLNRTELPDGTNLQVKVDATCVSGVQVRIMRGSTEVGPLTSFVNGSATITLPTLPDMDGRYELFAELVRGTTVLNTRTSNPPAVGTIQVSRALPSCSLTVPAMCLGPSADADTMTPGFQLRVTGSMTSRISLG